MNGRPYTAREDAYVRQHYRQKTARQIAEHLGRTPTAIYQRAMLLGLRKSPPHVPTEDLRRIIRTMHADGYTDHDIETHVRSQYRLPVERHRISRLRRAMGLASNALSQRRVDRIREKTRQQLDQAGLQSLAELRYQKFAEWKRSLGWPEHLTVRAVQALEIFWQVQRPLTRVELCQLMGVESRSRTAPKSNAPGGTVLAELQRAGLVARACKSVRVPGDLRVHQEPRPARHAGRTNAHKYLDSYFLVPGVSPDDHRSVPEERPAQAARSADGAGDRPAAHRGSQQRHPAVAS